MSPLRPLVLVSALLSLTGFHPIAAQETQDSVDRYAFDLDTQSGHYSSWELRTLRHNCLRAKLIIGELRKHRSWAPAYALWLENGDDRAFLRIWAPQRTPPLVVVLLRGHDRQITDSALFTRTLGRGDTFHVSLDWSRSGVLRAVLDAETHEIGLPFRPTSFRVSNSTSQLKADSLELDRCQ
jgi:hypothetical protein